jgi:hypothetical protein
MVIDCRTPLFWGFQVAIVFGFQWGCKNINFYSKKSRASENNPKICETNLLLLLSKLRKKYFDA